ncbi:MAG: hypothetical protein UY54_C0005G0010 [Parcubacteria group bacterium GW2011_GWA2_50_10b]|nr:MAG: hypothetical protein UY54_C0005G0010 [Parcubacteria group bacterium GW2011_GWA2_50_10b]
MQLALSGGENISRGDPVQQVGPFALIQLNRPVYVLEVVGSELELSNEPNGPPLKDLSGQPMHFPIQKFRKVAA